MTLKKKILCIGIAMLLVITLSVYTVRYDIVSREGVEGLRRPSIETKTERYIVPWPWELVYQDGALWMRLKIENEDK